MKNRVWTAVLVCILGGFALACSGGGDEADAGSTTSRPNTTTTRATTERSVVLSPRSGPPGTEVTATGSGWPPGVEVIITGVAQGQAPYTTAFTDGRGAFKASFILEKKPDGSDLETGAMQIIASAGNVNTSVSYIVEVRRPVSGPGGPGGG